jgi:hypothetical protein
VTSRILTWVIGVGLLLIGVASWMARTPYGVQLTEIDARADVNAVIVGLHLAVGSAIIVCAACRLHLVGLLIATLTATGLAALRIIEMAAGDAATTRQWILLASEIAGVILSAALVIPRLPELRSLSPRAGSGAQ